MDTPILINQNLYMLFSVDDYLHKYDAARQNSNHTKQREHSRYLFTLVFVITLILIA